MITEDRRAGVAAMRGEWTVCLALKSLVDAKGRLSPFLSAAERADLVVAMASDVVAAALASARIGRVIVVTPDADLGRRLGTDVLVLCERRASGLNDAYARARDAVGRAPLALVAADLPRLRATDLEQVTAAAEDRAGPVVVADCEGSGTTVLAGPDATRLTPRFGVGSRAAHVGEGAEDLSAGCAATVRHDVDTFAGLAALCAGGVVGRATASWLARMGECLGDVCLPCPHDAVDAAALATVGAAWSGGGVR